MGDLTKIPLISSEITGLWNSYMSDTMMVCVLKHCSKNVEDVEIRAILQQTLDLTNQHIQELTNMFDKEKMTIPEGFTDKDVNINAPRLFTDSFYLNYLSFMSRIEMRNNTLIINQIGRSDIRDYFSTRINEYVTLYNNSSDLRLAKGIFIKAPSVEVIKEVKYVKGQSFMIDMFREKRPLLTSEITDIFSIMFANIIARAIITGFGQVSKVKEISDYFFDGLNIETLEMRELTGLLTIEGIPIPSTSDSFLTGSTVAPFSEKLMLSHLSVLSSSRISNLGMAMAHNMRGDIETKYMKYLSEVMKYHKKGANIMIDNNWLEQSPQVVKHEDLVGV